MDDYTAQADTKTTTDDPEALWIQYEDEAGKTQRIPVADYPALNL